MRVPRGSRRGFVVALIVAASWTTACREGDIKVASLRFEGVRAFEASALQAALATKSSGRFP